MKQKRTSTILIVLFGLAGCVASAAEPGPRHELANAGYRLVVETAADQVKISLDDKRMGLRVAEGAYVYRAQRQNDAASCSGLENVSVVIDGVRLTIRGKLAGLDVEHTFDLPADRPIMEERIAVHNSTDAVIALVDLQMGLTRIVADSSGSVLSELAEDRFVAVPFRAKPDDVKPHYNDFSTADLINTKGYEVRVRFDTQSERVPADRRQADGWAWTHGDHTLGILKFDQENMQWSILAVDKEDAGTVLRFGGVCVIDGEPSDLSRVQPGQTVRLGLTRYQTMAGGYQNALYAFRDFLNEQGCRFPKGFDPPVHWEQLYNMEGAWDDRLHKYTKAIAEREAEKGVAYSCESLYLDPGWDTDFATFLWGDKWLGPRAAFVEEMKSKYGSKAYLDEAARRLLANCADGVAFLMYDGNLAPTSSTPWCPSRAQWRSRQPEP